MKYPMINKRPHREVNVPQLSGGLNLRDGLTGVRDNQLTDCVNMWYKDGCLRTRPNFYTKKISNYYLEKYEDSNMSWKIYSSITNEDAILVSVQINYNDSIELYFYWQKKNELSYINYLFLDSQTEYFVVEKDNSLYCYTTDRKIYTSDISQVVSYWRLVDEEEYYVPTVMAHCQRNGTHNFKGTMLEGYNLISDKYKMVYSTYNENDSESTHPMRYAIINPIEDDFVGDVTAEITIYDSENDKTITTTHTVHIDGSSETCEYYETKENSKPADELLFYVKKDYVGFLDWEKFGTMAGLTAYCIDTDDKRRKYGLCEDNLVLILPCKNSIKNKRKVFGMTQSVWFGGMANGINGGTRLFLCGNVNKGERALVLWSALNNPLYFNENNYVYVGNELQPVTAFGRQGDKLIIFKPNEIYYSYYQANDSIGADELTGQTVVDYEANSVFFPIVTLHTEIGCDCPKTIQLCKNRLVWLNSKGKVYTLVSTNQYNEMAVYAVSDMVEKQIRKHTVESLRSAMAGEFEGHYVLIVDNNAYLMDYNSYGYTHIYSYTKTDDANVLIPWYFWSLLSKEHLDENENIYYVIIDNGIMAVYTVVPSESTIFMHCSTLESGNNTGKDEKLKYNEGNMEKVTSVITSKLQTKIFDFSAAGYLKNIDRVGVAFGNNGGSLINARFVTDVGCENKSICLIDKAMNELDVDFIRVKNFYPSMKGVRTFGLQLECDGQLCIDGLSMKYRVLGGVK